ncbi:hypothetical protein KIN20_002467 [Parelaphostrongylus tenuis]|uniref:Uncharacterized protein n=1 Tax=Parelaphostrongylus tenuis TaxID=148309 RepID=A0AAD5LVQ2_PARTN|nr:hypothetical protein KIN20_002467 [Parelaphostrongylus tenuis]
MITLPRGCRGYYAPADELDPSSTSEMGSIADDDDEIVEDRFDDESFYDAPLSDHESNFDEMELRECDPPVHQQPPTDQIYSQNNRRHRPALSTIAEESKIEDVQSNEITVNRHLSGSSSNDDCSSFRALLVKSDDFITDQRAADIIEKEQQSFLRDRGRFIPDDPRFNRSHFEKENSWEPSVVEYSSFENIEPNKLDVPPVPKETGDFYSKSSEESSNSTGNNSGQVEGNDAQVRAIEGKDSKSSHIPNEQCDLEASEVQKRTLCRTPKRILQSSFITNESPNLCNSSTGIVQTSTPISVIAGAASRTRHDDLADKFHGLSVIMPEDSTAPVEQSMAESTVSTNLSVRRIHSVLKTLPASSSPGTLMKVLDECKRSRVKARKAGAQPVPSSFQNNEPSLSSRTSSHLPPPKSSNIGGTLNKTADLNEAIVGENEMLSKSSCTTVAVKQDCAAAYKQEKAPDDGEVSSRPLSSAKSSCSSSTTTGVRCSSQISTNPTRRSVLYIPQLEVAFGFVAIGDTAISNVDVTNRTDHCVRIRAKLSHSGVPFTLLDSQILLLDAHRTVPLRIEFSPAQNARFCTYLLIAVEGGGGPQVNYRMPVRGLGGTAVITVKVRDDLRISRNGTYILQSSYESTFSFSLTNSGNRRAFSYVIVLCTSESGVPEQIPADIRPAPGIVIDRGESKLVSVRLRSPALTSNWRSSQNSLVSTASTSQQRGTSELQVMVYWGEERTRLRLRCFENLKGISHQCEGIRFTDFFVGEDPTFCPPEDHPITKEDLRLFDQTLRMCTIYVCSPRVRPSPSLISNYSSPFERSLQPEDTFRERSTYKVAVPDQTLR